MLGGLDVSTRRLFNTKISFLLFFWIIKLAMLPALITEDYSSRASSTPSYFLRRFDLLRNFVSDRFVLDLATLGILQTGQLLS
jgi:hypothetical protein